jgi:glycosyltransferase involved in cell wall biosynthesis
VETIRIGIDARILGTPGSGVRTHTEDLINTLLKIDKDNEYILYITPNVDTLPLKKSENTPTIKILPSFTFKAIGKLTPIKNVLQDNLDVFHSPSYFLAKYPLSKTKFLTSFHGIVFEFYNEPSSFIGRAFWKSLARSSISAADQVIAVSERLKEEILWKYSIPETKVNVTYSGVSKDFRPLPPSFCTKEFYQRFGLSENNDFIFSLGGNSPIKNIVTLIKAFSILKQTYGFKGKLIIRRVSPMPDILQHLNLKINEDVLFLPQWMSREDVIALYGLSLFTVFPSLYEGIGAPVIEAMACGKSVIVTDSTAMSEVLCGAGLAVKNPGDPKEWASAMATLYSDVSLRKKYEQIGIVRSDAFSWENVAKRTIIAYRAARGYE